MGSGESTPVVPTQPARRLCCTLIVQVPVSLGCAEIWILVRLLRQHATWRLLSGDEQEQTATPVSQVRRMERPSSHTFYEQPMCVDSGPYGRH
ncbi:hypothetical protein BJX68DRAFT_230658 [Aspergillus pseudodeflectus]|uniref:Uncharacterized protein n=1 Tax=Aspergillus pseudodeflectus TaxID=176178 RepID=A0ABR4KVR4_9EURO